MTSIRAYHGTGTRFERFHECFVKPHFFTPDREYALAYVGKIMPVWGKSPTRGRNYLLTVELSIQRMLDTQTNSHAVDFYNNQFLPEKNRILAKYGKPTWEPINLGQRVSFINADDLWRFCSSHDIQDYDGMLVDEGGFTQHPAIVPFKALQITILKRQIVK